MISPISHNRSESFGKRRIISSVADVARNLFHDNLPTTVVAMNQRERKHSPHVGNIVPDERFVSSSMCERTFGMFFFIYSM